LDLDVFAPDSGFARVAGAVLDTHAGRIRGRPLEHVSLALAAHKRTHGHTEVVVTTDGEATGTDTTTTGTLPESIQMSLASTYLPDALLAPRPSTDTELDSWLETLELAEAPPIWRGRTERDGEPTVYVCEDRACSPPSHSLSEALSWFAGDEERDGASHDGGVGGDLPFDRD
jgi:uncharacterized protein YyaL (SSP411 family)